MQDIREFTIDQLREYFIHRNEKSYRAGQVFEWLWKKHICEIDQMTNLSSGLRQQMKQSFTLEPLKAGIVQISKDGTRKIGFKSADNMVVEGVLIPSRGRFTACISSQSGCPLNCSFCATGIMGFKRNLSAGEIFDQVAEIEKIGREIENQKLNNIVLMGMGEPLLNYNNAIRAIEHISSDDGLGYSPRRITLSTVGIIDLVKKMGDDDVRFNLAISLHTANNAKRSRIMPVNKSNPLPGLSNAIKYFHAKTGSRITYEYLMLRNFNDSLEDAKELAEFCKIAPCKINLIEYNEVQGSPFQRSDPSSTRQFAGLLESRNLVVNIRKSRGEDIDAACGQLAGKEILTDND